MKNTIRALSTLTLLFLFSCSKETPLCCAGPPFTGIKMTVVDTSGNDLLNPENPKAFSKDSIRIYHLENGEKELVDNPQSDTPSGFSIFPGTAQQNYRITPSLTLPTKNEKTTITYIHWNSRDIDTLKSKYSESSRGTQYVDTLWVNNKKLPPFSHYDYKPAQIIKNR